LVIRPVYDIMSVCLTLSCLSVHLLLSNLNACMYVVRHPSAYLPACQSVCQYVCLTAFLSACTTLCPSACLPDWLVLLLVHPCVCLPDSLPTRLSINLYVCQSVFENWTETTEHFSIIQILKVFPPSLRGLATFTLWNKILRL